MFRCGDGIIYIPETLTCFGFGGGTDGYERQLCASHPDFVYVVQFNDTSEVK